MRSLRPIRRGSSVHGVRGRSLGPAALPALLRATHLLGLALGSALGKLRDSGVTAARMFERAEESALLLRMTREAAGTLGARWDRVPERHRPHYPPEQRFRILRIRSFLGLSQRETAEMFRVSTETIARWETETTNADDAPRPLIAPNPPVRRFADVVRALVKTMELAGFGGNDLIARTLARAGWKLSARTVGRIRKERWPVPRVPEAASTVPRAVRAKRPNHVWMVDLTDVKGLFGLATRDLRKSRIKPSMLRGYEPRMSQRKPAREAKELQSAEVRTPPFGHLVGFWRGAHPSNRLVTLPDPDLRTVLSAACISVTPEGAQVRVTGGNVLYLDTRIGALHMGEVYRCER